LPPPDTVAPAIAGALPWHTTGKQKPAACFARRVNRASQKYIYFRKKEIMI
jgi:hypothetical protein